ncbi:MAG: hypothetical protein KGZ30_02705 [Anaplasmataceae bacterium]|nr:hypothetical protein [Anaplasmataceae bacterium]
MAIVIEQEKSKSNLLVFIGWLAVMITVVVIIYYIFFQNPELVPVTPTVDFSLATQVSQIDINPSIVINDANFNNRQPYVSLPGLGEVGRFNPFLPY